MADIKDTMTLIGELEQRYGVSTADKLVKYIDLVLERNEFINLTAVRDRDEAMQKHLADSLAVTALTEYEDSERIIDVGTGAGFPGALLAIASPDKEFVLLDSTRKRLRVIDEFAQELGVTNIRTVHSRAEDAAKLPEYSERFDMCVSRAVADLNRLSAWCLPFVKPGGIFAPYKGLNYLTELKEAEKTLSRFRARFDRTETDADSTEDISGHVILVIRKY